MPIDQLNYLAIVVAAAAAFGIGAVWFSFLFAKPWLAAIGKKREELGSPTFAIVANIFNLLLTAFVLSVIYHWYEPLRADWLIGFWVGFLVWGGFVFTTRLVGYLFEGQNLPLFLVDTSHFLVIYLVMGSIIGGWR